MEQNYLIILFKNKVKKRIIKKFVTLEKAKKYLYQKKQESSDVIFEKSFENGKECSFEMGLVKKGRNDSDPVYFTDEFGRNIKVRLLDDNMSLLEVYQYKKEEKIFDIQLDRKLSIAELIKKYLSGSNVKLVSSVNNKIIIQEDEKIFLFSLKNEEECFRFLDCLSSYFFRVKKTDCIIVKENSTAQRKYLIKILSDAGFDKKLIYRKHTTYPR